MVTRAVSAGRLLTPLACVLGMLVFVGLSSFGVRTYRASIMPMALLAAVLAMLLVYAVAPGTLGY